MEYPSSNIDGDYVKLSIHSFMISYVNDVSISYIIPVRYNLTCIYYVFIDLLASVSSRWYFIHRELYDSNEIYFS